MLNHKEKLREIAKFASGLVVGDLAVLIWAIYGDLFPLRFAGIAFTREAIVPWFIFDVLLLALLVHYGWHAEIYAPSIHQRSFFITVGIIFLAVMLVHFSRLLFGIQADIGSWSVPLWISWIGFILAGYLAYSSFHFALSSKE